MKTAYELLISDWSSDVCSSYLRRSQQPDHRAHEHQHAELHRVHAYLGDDGHEDGHRDDDDGHALEEQAHGNQHQGDQGDDFPGYGRYRHDGLDHGVGNALVHQEPGQESGRGNDEQHAYSVLQRRPADARQVGWADFLVDKQPQRQAIEHGDDTPFGGCEVAAGQPADDDDRRQHGKQRAHERFAHYAQVRAAFERIHTALVDGPDLQHPVGVQPQADTHV